MSKEIIEQKEIKPVKQKFIFDKQNYFLIIAAVAVIAIGFIMMSGTEDIYSSMKITVAPIVVLLGFGIGFYAIMKKPTDSSEV